MTGPEAPDDDLRDVRAEPEPAWVEELRRARDARARRLKALLAGLEASPEDQEEPPA